MIEMPYTVDTPPQLIAYIPLVVSCEEIQEVMGPGIQEVFAAISDQGIIPAGPWFTYHHRAPTDSFDFRICVPVTTPLKPVGRVEAGELPGGHVARTLYSGDYAGLGEAWGEFMEWVEEQGLTPAAHLWEVYLVGPDSTSNPEEWRTQLNRPLAG
jgi:effector-binding domain-containing protein